MVKLLILFLNVLTLVFAINKEESCSIEESLYRSYDIKNAKFHLDFPPKELIDFVDFDERWRTRMGGKAEELAQWFQENVPTIEPMENLTEQEKKMYSWGTLEYIENFKEGKVTCLEYVNALIKRIIHFRKLNAFFMKFFDYIDQTKEQAKAIDEKREKEGLESVAPLYGLPIALKGVIATKDFPTSSGTGILDNFMMKDDADLVKILRKNNAVFFQKTNTPEFGCSWMTMNYRNGVTRNPYNPALSPGGSSGGSGVAVAARLVPMSISEDTGGSTRHPAHNNGIFGYDPFRNKFPNEGCAPITETNDQVGLHTRSFEEILFLDPIITGKFKEHEIAKTKVDKLANKEIKIGFPEEFFQKVTVPKQGADVFGLESVRATESVRNSLSEISQLLAKDKFSVIKKDHDVVYDENLEQEIDKFYQLIYGHKLDGEHIELVMPTLYSLTGGIAKYLKIWKLQNPNDNLESISIESIIDDLRNVGHSHTPRSFFEADEVIPNHIFRFLMYHVLTMMEIWNSYFDKYDLDMIITPTQHGPTMTIAEMVNSTGPLDVLQKDGSYKVENVGNAVKSNYFLHYALKLIPISKIQIPMGLDKNGRPFGLTIWGRTARNAQELTSIEFTKTFDLEWLYKVERVLKSIGDRRVEPVINDEIFSN